MISKELKEALIDIKADCCVNLYGHCETIGCMKKIDGKFVKPYEFVGCSGLLVFNAYVHAEAMRRKAEHQSHLITLNCPECQKTDADWEAEVRRELVE